MATEKVAQWAVNLSYSSLPNEVVQAAVNSFYNWVGCAIGGSSHPTTTTAHDALAPFFGAPTSTLLGRKGARTDASHAALINGIASHVHDYDDTHLETIIHPTGPVASALLAQSEALGTVSGHDFILALVVGIEAECKLGLGVWPQHYDIGWCAQYSLHTSVEAYSNVLQAHHQHRRLHRRRRRRRQTHEFADGADAARD
jgi:2-methylcitrate dehydratase PrpD